MNTALAGDAQKHRHRHRDAAASAIDQVISELRLRQLYAGQLKAQFACESDPVLQ